MNSTRAPAEGKGKHRDDVCYVRDTATWQRVRETVLRGEYVAILGPKFCGKTLLLQDVVESLRDEQVHYCTYCDLDRLHILQIPTLFQRLARALHSAVPEADGLGLPLNIDEIRDGQDFRYLLAPVLASSSRPVLVALDHIEALPQYLAKALLRCFRVIYNERDVHCEYGKIILLTAGALNLFALTASKVSPFNIAHLIPLADMDNEQSQILVDKMAQCLGARFSVKAARRIIEVTEGDRYLIRRLCQLSIVEKGEGQTDRVSLRAVNRAIDGFVTLSPHADSCLGEMVRAVEAKPFVFETILDVLRGEEVKRRELLTEIGELELTGALKTVGHHYAMRNQVYARFLRGHLDSKRVARIFSTAGRWDEAIRYFEEGDLLARVTERVDYLAAVVSRIYAEADDEQAFHYIARALERGFGVRRVVTYSHDERNKQLVPVVPGAQDDLGRIEPIQLYEKSNRIEARAFYGGDDLLEEDEHGNALLVFPLPSPKGVTVGTVTLCNHFPIDRFVEHREEVLEIAGFLNQAAQAIATIREKQTFLQREQQKAQELAGLNKVALIITAALNIKELLAKIVESAGKVVGADYVSAVLVGKDGTLDTSVDDFQGVPPLYIRARDQGKTREIIRTGKSIVVDSVSAGDPREHNPAIVKAGVESYAGIPITSRGQVLGVLFVYSRRPEAFGEQVPLLITFASQAAVAIQNARFFDSAQHRIRDLEIVNDIVQIISTKLDTQDLLQAIVSQIADQLNCTHCTLFFPQKEEGELWLVPQVTHGVLREQIMTRRFKSGEGLAGWVLQHGESLVLPDARADPRFSSARLNPDRPRSMLVVPVKVGDRTIGVISADQDEFGWFGESDRRLVDALARQVGIAIERAIALELLHDIGNRIISAQKVDDTLQQIVSGAIKLTNTTSGVIYLLSEDGKSVIKSFQHPPDFDFPKPRMDREKGLTRQVIATGEMLVSPDIRQDTRVNHVLHDRFRSMIAIPLKLGERKVIGVLYLHDTNPHSFTETEVSLLSTLATQAAIAIVNARLLQNTNEALQKRVAEMKTLQDIDEAITSTLELDAILGMILDRALALTEATFGHLQLVSEDGQEIVLATTRGATLASIGKRLKLGESVTGKAAQDNRTYRIADVQSPEWAPIYRPYIPNMRSELAVPMSFEDRVVGVINIESADVGAFSEDDERLLKGLAKQAAIAIHNARLYEAIKRQSQHWQALCEASKAIAAGSAAERKQVLNRIVEQAVECITGIKGPKAVWGAIMLYDEAANELWFESVYPFKVSPELEARLGEGWFLDRGKAPGGRVGITGRTVLEKKPQRVEDVRTDPDYLEFDVTVRSELDVPLLDGDRVIGVLSLESDQVGAFDEDDEQALEGLAELAVIAIKNAEQAEQLSRTHAVALMGAWGADIVHDVNREVGAIRRAVFLLQQRSDLPGEVKERLQEIDRYAGNLALPELPEQAPESGRILEFRNASFLDKVIQAEVENLQPAHPSISFKLEQNCLGIQVAMHEQLLRRLVRHLIYNAIGAIPSDKETQLVTIRTAVQGSLAEVQVEDTGKGVRPEIKPMLFQQPIPHEDDRPGRGLLLVRFLAEQHGGYARLLWSQPGEGARFAFGIPLAQPVAGSA